MLYCERSQLSCDETFHFGNRRNPRAECFAGRVSGMRAPPAVNYKLCNICKVEKPTSEFSLQKSGKHGVRAFCKACRKDKPSWRRSKSDYRKWAYGLSKERMSEMITEQRGRCAICERSLTTIRVDHCHFTGVVRGVLCSSCNVGLGLFKDDPGILLKAVAYLSKFPVDRTGLPFYKTTVRRVTELLIEKML